ncbi:MAG: NAD(P)-dependent oxidoreductase [Lachnospiraceae bacterium]
MKIAVYSYNSQKESFEGFEEQFGCSLLITEEKPDLHNVSFAEGAKAISVVTTPISGELIQAFYDKGVRYISTRTIGYNHIDLEAADRIGMKIGNVTYSPHSVAEFAVMLILMSLRKAKQMMASYQVQDFSVFRSMGGQLHNKVVGVIGTGNIGRTVISILEGFGCNILAYDKYPNEKMKNYYVSFDELLEKSDVITLHIPMQPGEHYLIDKRAISKMKDGAIIVNTARGQLIDTDALIEGIETKHLGAALDVLEDEQFYFKNKKNEILRNRNLAILRSFPNVILTPHFAFFTDQAVKEMAENSISSCILEINGEENPWRRN